MTKSEEKPKDEQQNTGDYDEAILGIIEPKSDNDKKVIGSVTFKKQGLELAAIGKVSGFPDGGTIEHEGDLSSAMDKDALVKEMIIALQSKIESKYSVSVKLEIKEKRPQKPKEEPKGEEENLKEEPKNPPVERATHPKRVSGTFQLVQKSGPGVMIGVTEVEIVEGVADFSGIQFDQPGDYVIGVASKSPDIDSVATEIKIKVLPEPEAIPQEPKGKTASESTGSRPIISQISNANAEILKVKPMAFDRQDSNMNDTAAVSTGAGTSTVFINYNGVHISDKDIVSMNLYHDGMIPKVDITFRDTTGMIALEPPRDNTCFEVYIDPKSIHLKKIHLKMQIVDHSKLPNNAYQFKGTLYVPELYRIKFKVYRGTSFNILKTICTDLGLGFNSNIDDTKDDMPWRNIGDKQFKFMQEIVKHSYLSEESFMAGYIDYYYCFNYVDVEKEMQRDVSDDMSIETGGFDTENKEPEKISSLILTTEKASGMSNLYFVKTGERNEATKTSMEQGYKTRTKFYDKVKKMFLVFDVDSTTSKGEQTHILKGAAGDTEAFDNNYVTKYEGKIDTDNTHKNYNYAVTQNRINLDNMVKMQMDISLPNPNLCLYKYMKVRTAVVKENATPSAPEKIQWRWSGEWLISDISFAFTGGKLEQKATLVRKEMGKDPEEMKQNDSAAKQEKKEEKNENPIAGSQSTAIAKPNEAYKPGEEYTVQDSNGVKYVVKIISLSENGNDVKAEIRDVDYVYPASETTNAQNTAGVTQSGPTQSGPTQSGPTQSTPDSVSGYYPYDVILDRIGEENTQFKVTTWISSHAEYTPVGGYKEADQNIYESNKNSANLYIAIKRPIPDFKPGKEEKNMTPHSWVMFNLYDAGIGELDTYHTLYYTDGSRSHVAKYEIARSRLIGYNEEYLTGNQGTPEDLETISGIRGWTVDRGYVRVLDSSGNIAWGTTGLDGEKRDSSFDHTGSKEIMQGRPSDDPNDTKKYFGWFRNVWEFTDDDEVPLDQLYTYVGGDHVIFIDMSNPAKFPAGTYTLELKYNVPLYEKTKSGFPDKKRLRKKDALGKSPYESKILRETFTISRKSQRRKLI